jgi:abortive infection alpha-like protein
VPDNSLIPISDEQAKAIQEALKVLQGLGSFLDKVLGDVPQNLVNYLGGDWLRVRRAENLYKMISRAKDRLEAWRVETPISPSLSVTIPLLRDAADESREEVQELWARLLAATMDPTRTNFVRQRFVQAVRILDPPDTRVLTALLGRGGGVNQPERNVMGPELGMSRDEVDVSLTNLIRAELVFEPTTQEAALSPFGREFLRVVMD